MTTEEFIKSISLEGEEWRDVVGYEGLYAVSNLGRVISFERDVYVKNRNCTKHIHPKIVGIYVSKRYKDLGYHVVNLSRNGLKVHSYVHRLVAEAFISNPDNNPCVDHIDRNTLNNTISNLRWVTHIENMNNENTLKQMSKSTKGILKPSRYIPIVAIKGDEVLKFSSNNEAKELGFHPSAICRCCKGLQPHHKGYKFMYLSDYEASCQ